MIVNKISQNLINLNATVGQLALGQLQSIEVKAELEIEEMADSINYLVKSLNDKSNFAEQIGLGHWQAAYLPSSEYDVLGKSLVTMRNNLFANAEAEKQRNWTNEHLNKVGDIMKLNQNLGTMCDEVLKAIVKSTQSLQGGIYIYNDSKETPALALQACYAYERKKYINSTLGLGEGIVGQVFLEKQTVYLSEIPETLTIGSGMGSASPKYMLVVPLMVNNEANGVLLLASFIEMPTNVITFVEKSAENLALSVYNVKVASTTLTLLQESQRQTEQMKSQEEELRQNMEELSATQEEITRKEKTYIDKIADLETKITA